MRRALVVASIVACKSAPHAPQVTLPPQPIASAAPTATAARPNICARVLEEQRAKVSAAIVESKKEKPGEWTDAKVETDVANAFFDRDSGMGVACHRFARGAWALEAESIEVLPDWRTARAELAVVIYAGDDRVALADKIPAGDAGTFVHVQSQLASDYDGDGVPELWVRSEEEGVEGGHGEEDHLFTFHRGAIEPYGPASKLEDLGAPRDVDGDGLLDFPAGLGVRVGDDVECFGKEDWSSAKLLAHARKDGTFSTNDDVAKSFVKSWCAAAPSKVTTPEEALCARLWNRPRTMVTTSCVKWDCALEAASKPQPKGATKDCEARIDAYDATVPFTLP